MVMVTIKYSVAHRWSKNPLLFSPATHCWSKIPRFFYRFTFILPKPVGETHVRIWIGSFQLAVRVCGSMTSCRCVSTT